MNTFRNNKQEKTLLKVVPYRQISKTEPGYAAQQIVDIHHPNMVPACHSEGDAVNLLPGWIGPEFDPVFSFAVDTKQCDLKSFLYLCKSAEYVA